MDWQQYELDREQRLANATDRVASMTLDELDMTQSDVSTVMMNFVYDSVYINSPAAANAEAFEVDRNRANSNTVSGTDGTTTGSQTGGQPIQGTQRGTEQAPNTITFSDIRGRIQDVERLVRRVRRLDTLPNIGVSDALDTLTDIGFIPPITGNLPNIPDIQPIVDPILPEILDF